jgi:hypothetical protein
LTGIGIWDEHKIGNEKGMKVKVIPYTCKLEI